MPSGHDVLDMFWNFRVAYIYTVVLTTQGLVLGNLPQGFRWINQRRVHPHGAQSPWHARPPSGAQVSVCDQSLKHFVRWDSPISQSVIWLGPQVVGDSAEAVRSGRASTCAPTLIPHAGGDLSWAGRSSSDAEKYFFSLLHLHICVHLHTIHLWCMSTQKYVWEKVMYIDISFLSMTQTKLSFIPHTAIKRKTLLAWRDSKHVSWKIYGSLELNCAGLLLEKDRWGLSRDMFYQFDFRCMLGYWRNATCILL